MTMQIFISYKSEDSNEVRKIVDILIAAGVDVWFTEYKVLPKNYEIFDSDIDTSLKEAVSNCSHALVFTNNRWSKSEYCRMEMKAIIDTIPAQDIIEIGIPSEEMPHLEYPILKHCMKLDYIHDPEMVAMTLLRHLGFTSTKSIRSTTLSDETSFHLWHFGLTVNLGPFKTLIKESKLAFKGHKAPTVQFHSTLNGQNIKLSIVLTIFDSVLRTLQISQDGFSSDRKVYNAYRYYAKNWEIDSSFNTRGLHLFFWNKRSQLAMTYVTQEKGNMNSQGIWERRFVLSPRGATPVERGEIHFIFYTDFYGTTEEQFRKFIALCPFFEQIMQTVQYDPATARKDVINSIPLIEPPRDCRRLHSMRGWGHETAKQIFTGGS